MKYLKYLSLSSLVLLVFLIAACEKDDGTIPVNRFLDNQDPGFNISFINKTAIDTLSKKLQGDTLTLRYLENLLDTINSQLEKKDLSDEERNKFTKQKNEEEAKIRTLNASLAKEQKDLTKLVNGVTTVDSLFIVDSHNNKPLTFKEAKVFRFPLRPDHTLTEYKIFIKGITDEFKLTVTYNLETDVVNQVIKRIAGNIEFGENTFDNIIIDTKTLDEHIYKAYY